MPGLTVIRPAAANETAQALRVHLEHDGPTALVLSRQKLPVLELTAERAPSGVMRGAYAVVDEEGGSPDLVLVSTGSEVHVCVEAQALLNSKGHSVRVVSMPSWELFDASPPEEQRATLPPGVPTLAVEAAVSLGWHRYADDVIAIDRFGASAPGPIVLEKLGFTPENVARRAEVLLAG